MKERTPSQAFLKRLSSLVNRLEPIVDMNPEMEEALLLPVFDALFEWELQGTFPGLPRYHRGAEPYVEICWTFFDAELTVAVSLDIEEGVSWRLLVESASYPNGVWGQGPLVRTYLSTLCEGLKGFRQGDKLEALPYFKEVLGLKETA